MSKNKFLFILAAASLLSLGSCGPVEAKSSTTASSAPAESSSTAPASSIPSGSSAIPGSSSSLISSSSSVFEPDEEDETGLIFRLSKDQTHYSVTGYKGSDLAIVIPAQRKGLPVTEIGEEAFSFSSITSISIPEGVTKIGRMAFVGSSLSTIVLPDSLKEVGIGAFASLTSGSGITFTKRDGLEYLPSKTNPYFLLAGVESNGVSISIPADVELIANGAFIACTGLKSFAIDSSNPNYSTDGTAILSKDQTTLFTTIPNLGTSYVVPQGITAIGNEAFLMNSSLMGITFPTTLKSIGIEAFYGCGGIMSVTLPTSLTTIKEAAFKLSGLESVSIPSSVTSIEMTAFSSCPYLAHIEVDSTSLAYTADGKALYDKAKTELVQYAIGLEETAYALPDSLTQIDDDAFYSPIFGIGGAASLTEMAFPASLKIIGNNAFRGCTGLTSLSLPASLASIGASAFGNCMGLTSVNFPASLVSIGASAFSGCWKLTSIELPAALTSIGDNAFFGCTGLTSIIVDSANPAYAADGKALYDKGETELLQYAAGSKDTTYECPTSLIKIGSFAFGYAQILKSVSFPATLTSIGKYAFFQCTALTSVTLPAALTSIEYGTFDGCKGLTSIELPATLTSIGDHAFDGCTALASVSFPSSLTSIGSGAFNGCAGLTSIIVDSANPAYAADGKALYDKGETELMLYAAGSKDTAYECSASLIKIDDGAFEYAKALTSVTFPATLTSIGNSAFNGYTALASVSFPSSLTSIAEYAFSDCTALTSVTLPAALTSIGDHAFDGCTALTSVSLPAALTSIGDWTFYGCKGLTSIELPAALTSIGDYAFSSCAGLTNVSIPKTVTQIGNSAFERCSALASLTYAGTKADWAKVTLGWYWHDSCPLLKAVTCTDGPVTL